MLARRKVRAMTRMSCRRPKVGAFGPAFSQANRLAQTVLRCTGMAASSRRDRSCTQEGSPCISSDKPSKPQGTATPAGIGHWGQAHAASGRLPTTRAEAERRLIANGAPPYYVTSAMTLTLAAGARARRYAQDGSVVDVDLELDVVTREREQTVASTHCSACEAIGVGDDGLCPRCARRKKAWARTMLVRYGLSSCRASGFGRQNG